MPTTFALRILQYCTKPAIISGKYVHQCHATLSHSHCARWDIVLTTHHKVHDLEQENGRPIADVLEIPWASYQIKQNCGLSMRRECRERFPRHRLLRKPLVSDPGMHHGTCVAHVPWCMPGSLIRDGGENVPGIPGACATHDFMYLARGPLIAINHRIIKKLERSRRPSWFSSRETHDVNKT